VFEHKKKSGVYPLKPNGIHPDVFNLLEPEFYI